ncbi:MAG: aromatic ring-hydroxylating dioxygenase subunit alpha [Rhodospirillaceae bacterium]|nr:aromatic ring-hydroxylating dioxygenase subunit alpha [Rhodospirillaceae bacterium]
MYMNFWYVAAQSHEVTDKPVKVRMLGQNFVLFRDTAGKVHCLHNVCTHRGGNLAGGKLKGDTVECPYHGWRFNGEGECVKIPSIGKDGKIPARTRIDSYPTQEKYDLVFAFLGDLPAHERPGIMDIPEWGKEGWRANLLYNEYKASYERAVENTLDPAHNEFVHPTHGYSGERETYAVPDYKIDEVENGAGFMMTFKSPELKDSTMSKLRNFAGDLEAGAGHVGPHQTWTQIHMSPTNWFHQYTFRTPVSRTETRGYLINMRNALLDPQHDDAIQVRQRVIQEQDITILEAIEPSIPPVTNTKEVLMPADRTIARYRQYTKEWNTKGWRIDIDAVERDAGRVVYAIPSPARRETKGWVMDTVPVVQTGEAKQAAE